VMFPRRLNFADSALPAGRYAAVERGATGSAVLSAGVA
jgi:hypothetical protein